MELDTGYLKYGIVKDKNNFLSGAECLGKAAQALYESAIKLGQLTRNEKFRVTCGNMYK